MPTVYTVAKTLIGGGGLAKSRNLLICIVRRLLPFAIKENMVTMTWSHWHKQIKTQKKQINKNSPAWINSYLSKPSWQFSLRYHSHYRVSLDPGYAVRTEYSSTRNRSGPVWRAAPRTVCIECRTSAREWCSWRTRNSPVSLEWWFAGRESSSPHIGIVLSSFPEVPDDRHNPDSEKLIKD